MSKPKTDFTDFADTHPNYFPGQYLLDDDFEIQHKYLSDRQHYHQQSLYVSGIIEGLEVEVGKGGVTIKPGSAIDNKGNLIILKDEFDFNPSTQGELYIKYSEILDPNSLQQENSNANSYTRWLENPTVGFAATADVPANAVKLATITINGSTLTLDTGVRSYSGIFLPNPDGNDLSLRSGGNANPNAAILNGSLTVTGTITGNIDATSINSGVLDIARIPNLSADKITEGTTTGNLTIGGSLTVNGTGNSSFSGGLTVNGTINLSGFTENDNDEWPKVTWYRDPKKGWDEGLLKHASGRGVFKKAGYGIHFHESREFGLWSSGWNALFAVEGKTGNTFIKGNVGIGIEDPNVKLDVKGDALLRGNLSFGATTRQMINLYQGGFGIGVQSWTQYFRTSRNFAWYKDGSHDEGELNAGDKGTIQMVINDGNVGIGTTSPTKGKVQIEGFLNYQHPSGYGYLVDKTKNPNYVGGSSGNVPYSLYASHRIGCPEFNAFSDLRIKEIKGNSDSKADLQTLLQIQVTDYYYKDKIANGNRPKKKVIGQQIAAVYPQAASTHVDIIPDILQFTVIAENWVTLNNHNLKVGDKVKILWDDNKTELFPVEAIEANSFKISLNYNGDVFVYGREVDDFHVVDYDALSMLHISATQEIYRIIKKMQSEMNELKKQKSLY